MCEHVYVYHTDPIIAHWIPGLHVYMKPENICK